MRSIGVRPQIHQRDVVAVEGLEIPGVDRRTLRRHRDGRYRRASPPSSGSFTISRILCRMNSAAVSLAALSISRSSEAGAELQPALLPGRLVDRLPLARARRPGPSGRRSERMPVRRHRMTSPDLGGAALTSALEFLGQRRIARRDAVIGRALEDGQVVGRLRRSPARPGCRSSRCRSWPTRLPVKSTPSCGHCPVWYQAPAKLSRPGICGMFADDRQPTAVIRNCARYRSPASVATCQRFAASS